MRARLRRRGDGARQGRGEDEFVEIDPSDLTDVFAAPRWLRDVGFTAWLLVGVTLLLVSVVWLLSLTETIVMPLMAASVVAAVCAPVVAWLARHRVPRGVGAVLILLAVVAVAVGVVIVVVGGISSQSGDISGHLTDAQDKIAGGLEDLGVDPSKASDARRMPVRLQQCLPRAARRRSEGHLGSHLTRLLPVAHRPQPRIPARGRPEDPGVG